MDSSKGIGSSAPTTSTSPKSKNRHAMGKAGQRTVRSEQKENSILPSGTPHSRATATPVKNRDTFNFDNQYRKLSETTDITDAEAIFKGIEKRKLPDEQLKKARNLMIKKSSIFVANTYLSRHQRKSELLQACSPENIERDLAKLKTFAGRLARFISAESIYKSLTLLTKEMHGVSFSNQPTTKNQYPSAELSPEDAAELVKTKAGLSDFISFNRRLPLFIMVINARMADGFPLEDDINQQLLKHHQQEAGKLLAKRVYEKQHHELGPKSARETCLQLLGMTDDGIFSQLGKHAMPQVKRIIELSPDTKDLPTYISMKSFRDQLDSYFNQDASE